MIYLAWLAVVSMGFILGLLGAGGAILTVPILVYLFGYKSHDAIIYSFFIVGILSLFAAVPGVFKRQVDPKSILWFGIPSVVVLFLCRRFLIPWIPEQMQINPNLSLSKNSIFMFLFGMVVLWVGYAVWMDKQWIPVEADFNKKKWHSIKIGLFIGLLCGLFGIGGGFIIIPALVILLGLDMNIAVNTSLTIISMNTIVGFSSSFQYADSLNWIFLSKASIVAICGMVGGLFWRQSIDQRLLRKIFAFTLMMIACIILTIEIFSFL